MQLKSKAEFFRLSKAGCLGNTLRQFDKETDALASDVSMFGLREIGSAGGGMHMICPPSHLSSVLAAHPSRRFNIDEAAPDTDVQLQGEVCRTARGLEGILGIRTQRRMRDSARLGLLLPVVGLRVKLLLDHFLDASSRDDLEILLELYPDATVEFAVYPYTLGRLPGRNTLIWEVRNY